VGHHHHHDRPGTGNIRAAFFLNLFFTIVEIAGGLLTNSLAILSDALHDLGDSLSLGLAWYFQKISGRGRDATYSYGYKRFSLLGAIVNSIILVIGSVFIIREAVPRIAAPEPSHGLGMAGLAVLGIIVNGAAVLRLKRGSSRNERIVSLHLMEDVLGWAAVLAGGITIHFTNWFILDPILSMAISLYILFNVFRNLSESIRIILQAVPDNIRISVIRDTIAAVDGVKSVHDLHVWSIDGEHNVLTVHVVVDDDSHRSHHEIKSSINNAMAGKGIGHCTIETEREGEECVLLDC
jgi:cobalt-zinc-cadmium efflux system protein